MLSDKQKDLVIECFEEACRHYVKTVYDDFTSHKLNEEDYNNVISCFNYILEGCGINDKLNIDTLKEIIDKDIYIDQTISY